MKKDRHLAEREKPCFGKDLVVVNIGIRPFYEDLKKLNVKVSHVDWEPPAGGDQEVTALLDKIL
jgi:FdrA protein